MDSRPKHIWKLISVTQCGDKCTICTHQPVCWVVSWWHWHWHLKWWIWLLLSDRLLTDKPDGCHWCLNGCQRWLTLGVPLPLSMVTPVQCSPIPTKTGDTLWICHREDTPSHSIVSGEKKCQQVVSSWDFHRVAAAALLSCSVYFTAPNCSHSGAGTKLQAAKP